MESLTKDRKLLNWLKSRPELYEQLERIQELELGDPELDKAELELYELVKAIGASSFQQILQLKSDAAEQRQRASSKSRTQGKKTPLHLLVWISRS